MTQLMEEEIDGGPLVPLQTSLFLDVNRCDGTALIFTEGPVFNVFDNIAVIFSESAFFPDVSP